MLFVIVRLIIVFTLLPLIELWLLMKISKAFSLALTIGLVLITGFIGALLARRQGLQVWHRIQRQLSQGQSPTHELLDGMLILLAGAVLITPGVLTDIAGFALLVPALRSMLKTLAASKFKPRARSSFSRSRDENDSERGPVIDAEFTKNPHDH